MKSKLLLFILLNISIFVNAQTANDHCEDAQEIIVTTTSQVVNFNVIDAVIENESACDGSAVANYADVWYEFTMPITGNLYINGTLNWNRFAIYDACNGTEILCEATSVFTNSLVEGNSYKLRVYRAEATATNINYQSFSIRAFELPTNTSCENPEPITVSDTQNTINFNINGAPASEQNSCNATTENIADIWYDFTMPFTGNLFINGTVNWNRFAIYDACGSTEIECENISIYTSNLVAGNTYKLRVFRNFNLAPNVDYQSFTIQAFELPSNDNCNTSSTIEVTTDVSTINFSVAGSELTESVGCDGTTAEIYGDIWYDFTMPFYGNLFINGTVNWNNFAIYNACDGTEISCGATNLNTQGLLANTNYKLRVFRNSNNSPRPDFSSFTIQAFEVVPNDDCENSQTITISSEETSFNFNITGANIASSVGCDGSETSNIADVWFDFIMPENGNVLFDGTVNWNNFQLFDVCNGTQIVCGFETLLAENLIEGNLYKLRIFRQETNASTASFQNFTAMFQETLSIDDNLGKNDIQIYPNPTNDWFYISSTSSIKNIELYDMLGKQVMNVTNSHQTDVSSLNSGVYVVKITSYKGEITKKIIKE
uniref:T9SS type A sorting domain-containing protein n=1 Tax=Gelidibacter sp. TaxID=2018083 RepID=UPI004048EBDB